MLRPVWDVVYVAVQVAGFGALAGLRGYLALKLRRHQ